MLRKEQKAIAEMKERVSRDWDRHPLPRYRGRGQGRRGRYACGYLWSASVRSTDDVYIVRIQHSQAPKGIAKGKAWFPFALFCFLLQEQKEVPAG